MLLPAPHLGHLIPQHIPWMDCSDPITQRRNGGLQKRGLHPARDEVSPLQFSKEGLEWGRGTSADRSEDTLANSQGRDLCNRKNLSPKHYCSRLI